MKTKENKQKSGFEGTIIQKPKGVRPTFPSTFHVPGTVLSDVGRIV